jgi:mercuric ion transport protein
LALTFAHDADHTVDPQSNCPSQLPIAPAHGQPAPAGAVHASPTVDNQPPTRSKITGGLAALACAACCALPFLIAAGVLTGAGAALSQKTLLAVSADLIVLALGMWRPHLRNTARKAAPCGGGSSGGNCEC